MQVAAIHFIDSYMCNILKESVFGKCVTMLWQKNNKNKEMYLWKSCFSTSPTHCKQQHYCEDIISRSNTLHRAFLYPHRGNKGMNEPFWSLKIFFPCIIRRKTPHYDVFFVFVSTAKISKISWTTINVNVAGVMWPLNKERVIVHGEVRTFSNAARGFHLHPAVSGRRPYRLTVIWKNTN